MGSPSRRMSWWKSLLMAALWLTAGSAVCCAVYVAILAAIESDYIEDTPFIDLTAFVTFIAIVLATGIALVVGSAKVHHTKRVAVCMAVLLLLGGCIVGLSYFIVSLLAWPGR